MQVSASDWERYIGRLQAVNRAAAEVMQGWMNENPGGDVEDMIAVAYAASNYYGDAAATLACEMYDALAEAQGAELPPAEPAETATYSETAKAVRGTMKNQRNSVPDTVSRLVKLAGADTMLQNARRDGAEWAWVPFGGETCAFCITLASRGWQRQGKKAAEGDHAEHIHPHCQCEYVVRFDGSSSVEGYDPDKYLEMYKNAEGRTPNEKMRSLRRELYAENKDRINEQKRVAYRNRKEGLSDGGGSGILEAGDMFRLSSHNMHNSSDVLHERVKHVPPVPGYDDVFIHGNPLGVSIKDANGIDVSIPGDEFINMLKNLNLENDAIRLCACQAGELDHGIGAYVAKEIGKPVMAPSSTIWIPAPDMNGISEMRIYEESDIPGRPDYNRPGHWRLFMPDGTIREVQE